MQCFGLAHVFVAETISSAVPCKGGLYIRQFGAVIVGNLLCFIIGLLVDVLKVIVSGCRDIKGPACSHRPKCFGAVVTYLGTAIFLAALKAIKKFGLCFDCDSFIALVQLWCDPGGTQEAPRKHPGGTKGSREVFVVKLIKCASLCAAPGQETSTNHSRGVVYHSS